MLNVGVSLVSECLTFIQISNVIISYMSVSIHSFQDISETLTHLTLPRIQWGRKGGIDVFM